MARRGFAVIFTFLGVALVVSIAGFVLLYILVGREPAVARQSVLVLRVGGDLAEVAGADVVGYLRGAQDTDGPLDRRQSPQGQGRCPRPVGPAEADRIRLAVLGQGAGDS